MKDSRGFIYILAIVLASLGGPRDSAAQASVAAPFRSLDYNESSVKLEVYGSYDDLVKMQLSLSNDGLAEYSKNAGFPLGYSGFFPSDYQTFLNEVILPGLGVNTPYLDYYYDSRDCPGFGYSAGSPYAESRYFKYETTHSLTQNKEISLQVTSFNSWEDTHGCWVHTAIASVYWEIP